MPRPLGVSIIAGLTLLLAGAAGATAVLAVTTRRAPSSLAATVGAIGLLVGMALLLAATGWGLWQLRTWGWRLALLVLGYAAIANLAGLLQPIARPVALPQALLVDGIPLLLVVPALIYLIRPNVRDAFN